MVLKDGILERWLSVIIKSHLHQAIHKNTSAITKNNNIMMHVNTGHVILFHYF